MNKKIKHMKICILVYIFSASLLYQEVSAFYPIGLGKHSITSNNFYSNQVVNNIWNINTWIESISNMPTGREGMVTVAVKNKIYCIGGFNGSRLNTVEIYDTISKTWEIGENMPTSRNSLTATAIGEKIYVIGGIDSSGGYSNKVEIYDTKKNTWSTGANMPTGRCHLASASIGNKIYVVGGNNTSTLGTLEIYDTESNTWTTGASMPLARNLLNVVSLDGKIYVIGGYGNRTYYDLVEVYDPNNNTWSTGSNMPTRRASMTSSVVENKIYCIGGSNGSRLNAVEIYDVKSDTWTVGESMPIAKSFLGSTSIEGKIYVIGGSAKGSPYKQDVDIYIAKLNKEEEAENAVNKATITHNIKDINDARNLVNSMSESSKKDEFQDRLNNVSANITLEKDNYTSNLDVYIKCENILQMSLDTNSITFEDFNGIEDVEKTNAVNISINSSLPYQLNAYLSTEIQNSDKTNTMDKQILNIKENSESDYKEFTNINEKVVLKDNCSAGNDHLYGIDIKLKGGIAHEKDVYKTTIKFEAEQK